MTNEQQTSNVLQEIAQDIKLKLPNGMGFALLTYELGPIEKDAVSKMLYVSNSQREEVVLAMTEFIKKQLDDPTLFGKDV